MRWWRGGASRQWKARAAGFSGPAVAMSAARRSSGDRRSGRWLTGTSARSAQPADRVVASQSAHRAHRLDATHRRCKRPQGFAAIQRDPSCGRGMTTSIAAGATSPNRPSPLSRASRRPRRSTQGRRGVARPAGQLSGWMSSCPAGSMVQPSVVPSMGVTSEGRGPWRNYNHNNRGPPGAAPLIYFNPRDPTRRGWLRHQLGGGTAAGLHTTQDAASCG
jgi:hypothetical protein